MIKDKLGDLNRWFHEDLAIDYHTDTFVYNGRVYSRRGGG